MEEWARCAVPNASLIYTSPNFVRFSLNLLIYSYFGLILFPFSSIPVPSSSG